MSTNADAAQSALLWQASSALLHSVPHDTVLSTHVPPFMHGCGLHPSFVVHVAPVKPNGQTCVVLVLVVVVVVLGLDVVLVVVDVVVVTALLHVAPVNPLVQLQLKP